MWAGQAFGLSIASCFQLPGLRLGVDAPAGERQCSIEFRAHAAAAGERVWEWPDPGGELVVSIDRLDGSYRFFARGAGVYELSADGGCVTCEPLPDSGWIWRRYLLAQVLPFAALLQGLEVFHASVVSIDGEAVALAGSSGVGKSTLALNLHLAGATFLSDDVLALEVRGPELLAHPGPAAAKVREVAADLVDGARLGPLVSSDAHERRYEVPTSGVPARLRTFCMLEPSADGCVHVTDAAPDPWRLLASTFNFVVATPERLRKQLEVCSALAEHTDIRTVQVPARPDATVAAELANRLGMRALVGAP